MNNENYHDIDGKPCSLEKLCRTSPEWAANRIRALIEQVSKAEDWVAELEVVIDVLEEKLNRITQWCKAYPRTVFIEPTPEQWARADHVLQQASDCPSLTAISCSNMRHVVEQIARLEKPNG